MLMKSDEESINETEEEVAMIKEEGNPGTEVDRDPNVRITRSVRVSRPPTKLTMA